MLSLHIVNARIILGTITERGLERPAPEAADGTHNPGHIKYPLTLLGASVGWRGFLGAGCFQFFLLQRTLVPRIFYVNYLKNIFQLKWK